MMRQPQEAQKMYIEWWDNLKQPQRCTLNDEDNLKQH